jgi:hypothetical protein
MNILIYIPSSVLSYHLETDMEIIQTLKTQGHNIKILTCKGSLKKSGYISCTGLIKCLQCKSKFKQAMSSLGIDHSDIDILPRFKNKQDKFYFSSISDLKNYKYKNIDIGLTVASTLISYLREPLPNVWKFKQYINESINNCQSLFDHLSKYLEQSSYDQVYLFNGRFAPYRMMMRACQKIKIDFYVHERSGVLNKYLLCQNSSPHDLQFIKSDIEKTPKENLDKTWYQNSLKGISNSWYSFTGHQNIQKDFRADYPNKKIISVFISSEDEFEAIAGWDQKLFKNQNEALHFIGKAKSINNDYVIIIRIHPNLTGLKNAQTQGLKKLNYHNFIIIKPGSKINTYHIINQSDLVITFGSSVGIEAAHMGKPSILLGRAFYEDLQTNIIPKSKEELLQLLTSPQINFKPNENNILRYGHWIRNRGIEFNYFKPTNLSNGTFQGKKITGNQFINFVSLTFTFIQGLYFVLCRRTSIELIINRVKNKI